MEIRKRLAEQNPQLNESIVANLLQDLALIYFNTQRYSESEAMYKECLEIRRKLAEQNPETTEIDLVQTLQNLADLYLNTQRYSESEAMYKECLEILRKLAEQYPEQYKKDLAICFNNLSFNCIFISKYVEAELYICKALEIDNSEVLLYSNLASSLLLQGKFEDAQVIYRQYKNKLKEGFLSDFEAFEKANVIPKEYYEDVEKIKQMLNE